MIFFEGALNPQYIAVQDFSTLLEAIKNSHNFWNEALAAGFGAFVGACAAFLLSYVLQVRQNRTSQILEIKYALISFICNCETVLMIKKDFFLPFQQEVKQLLAVETATPGNFQLIADKIAQCKKLFEIAPEQYFFEITAPEKLHFISNNSPQLLYFFHKTRETIKAINNIIQERNNFIWQFMISARPDNIRTAAELKRSIAMMKSFTNAFDI